jgi:hypothetical protein
MAKFKEFLQTEIDVVKKNELNPTGDELTMGEVIKY